jgi:hypothetical protein
MLNPYLQALASSKKEIPCAQLAETRDGLI